MNDEFNYNEALIERYLNNQLSPEEAKAFEKTLLDDPLLETAIQGYASADKEKRRKHLESMEKVMADATKKNKTSGKVATPFSTVTPQSKSRVYNIPQPSNQSNYNSFTRRTVLNIAALLIVMAGAGLVVYMLTNREGGQTENTASTPKPASEPGVVNKIQRDSSPIISAGKETEGSRGGVLVDSKGAIKTNTSKDNIERLLQEIVTTSMELNKSTEAEPVMGWESYKQYLQEQTDSTLKADGKEEAANTPVDVEFYIDKKGRPVQIKAAPGADKYLAEKATIIVSRGAPWKVSDINKKN